MIEVKVTQDMIREAEEKSQEMGKLKKSITKGKGNVVGFLGEILANTVIKGRIENTYDYDIVTEWGTCDVKTKKCKGKPEDYYDCSVAAYNTIQKCDYYVFVRIQNDLSVGWVLGCYPKEDYFNDAEYLRKGQRQGDNWFTVKANCYNIKIQDLHPIEENL